MQYAPGSSRPDSGDKARENCAVFGIYAPERDVSRIAYYGLFAMQHRGQESSGIAVANGEHLTCLKDMGLVSQVFDEDNLSLLKGTAAIGHNRYSTTGGSLRKNAQPMVFDKHFQRRRALALAHNGNLVNALELRNLLENKYSVRMETSSDSAMMGMLLQEYFTHGNFEDAIQSLCSLARGAYCLVVLTSDAVWAARDPWGVRPLCLGKMNKGLLVSSESCAFPLINAEYIREVKPGEIVRLDGDGITSWMVEPEQPRKHCLFEYFYFSRPDSLLREREVYSMRFEMGRKLWEESPVEADFVIGVPESGRPAAEGFSAASGIPVREGLVKNRYVARTFIQPLQSMRQEGVRMKYSPLHQTLEGKRVVLVDDSIVRGTTTREIPQMLFQAGAKEVHMRVSSPPIKYPCFYGVDFGTRKELIASKMSIKEIEHHLGVDSLHYISLEGVVAATGFDFDEFCLACFNDDYPIPLPQQMELGKYIFEQDGAKDDPAGGLDRL